MSPRQIVLAAALMALQATLLYLLSASSSRAAEVYRCGSSYQAHPCATGSGTTLVVSDERSATQQRQAQSTLERQQRAADALERSNRAWEKAHRPTAGKRKSKKGAQAATQPDAPVALGCQKHGRRPFESCADEAADRSSNHSGKPPAQARPFQARAPKQPPAQAGTVVAGDTPR